MPDADTRSRQALCPHCSQAMRYLGAATEVVPFWHRIGAFFRYPFHTDPLVVIAICTLVPVLAPANLLGALVWLVLALALFKYTYAVINHTAEGHLKPPPLATAFTGSGFNIVILQLLVFVLMGALVVTAAMLGGPILMLLVLAFAVLALPASIMVLAMERSVGAAVNPVNLAVLMARIGSPYFLLYGYLILLTVASGAAQDFAMTHFPRWAAQPLSGFLNSTFTLMLFHMLGYLLFQYQEELGFASDIQDDDENNSDNRQRDRSTRFDADLDMNLKDGHYERAQALLESALKNDHNNPKRLSQLYKLLTARNDTATLYRYHPRLFAWLCDQHDGAEMQTLLGRLVKVQENFQLDDPALSVRAAETLYHAGHYRSALRLLRDFHKRFPDSDQLAPAYLLAARILANGLQQWDKARAFLLFIKKRCAGHPIHGQIDTWLQQVEQQQPLKGPRANFQAGE